VSRPGTGLELAAVHADAFPHPLDPVPAPAGRGATPGRTWTVVGDLQRQHAGLIVDQHPAPVGGRVLDDVGDRLLDDPEGGQVQARCQRGPLAAHIQVHLDPGLRGPADQFPQAGQARRGEHGPTAPRAATGHRRRTATGRAALAASMTTPHRGCPYHSAPLEELTANMTASTPASAQSSATQSLGRVRFAT
jgi:hypothetical protein